jgi:hypothetical protein
MLTAYSSAPPVQHLWPWLELETGRFGKGPPSQYDRPGKFPIFRENSQFKLYLQRFRYTNHMEKLAEGRLLARYPRFRVQVGGNAPLIAREITEKFVAKPKPKTP